MRHLVSLALGLALFTLPAMAAERVEVRFGDHDGFSRTVFDWSRDVGFKVSEGKGRVTIRFARPASFDLANFNERGPRALTAVRASKDGRRVTISAPSGDVLRAFRLDGRIVVDIALDPNSKRSSRRQVARTAPAKPKPTARPARAASSKPSEPAAAAAVTPEGAIPVSVEKRPGRTLLRFEWPAETAAAAVHRGGHVWLAFATKAPLALPDWPARADGPILQTRQEPATGATLVRIDVATGAPLDLIAEGPHWIVDIGGGRGRAEEKVAFEAQTVEGRPSRLFAPISVESAPVIVDDPVIGDRIALVPLAKPGHGVRPERRFVKLDLLETPQGVAVRYKSHDLRIDAGPNGLGIQAKERMHLMGEAGLPSRQQEAQPPGLARAPKVQKTLLNLNDWRGDEAFTQARQRHLQRISLAKPAARNSERKGFARFLVSYGRGAEALGVMARIEAEDRRATLDPSYRATRGAARLLQGDLSSAASDLGHSSVRAASDAGLFRGLLHFQRREFDRASQAMKTHWHAIDKLPPEMQARLHIARAETALAMNDPDLATEQIGWLEEQPESAGHALDARFLTARVMDMTGEIEEAGEEYAELKGVTRRDIRAQARFAETNLLLREDRISVEDAIENLERLRFAWRGDVFEFDLMKRLGELYIDAGRYRDGMVAMREVIDRFPDLPEAQRLAGAMNDVFASLYEGRHAEEMSPVTALGLYYDFRELTPEGGRGDQMIRRLADRLAAVELLDEAAKLLEHQVQHRLKGTERSRVGARLAMLYLLDGQAKAAIGALRKSRNLSIPEDLARERQVLEARAQTDLGRHDRALAMLNGLKGEEIEELRTEVLWRARRWDRAAEALSGRLLSARGGNGPLALNQRRDILRFAIASSLSGDHGALKQVRAQFAERMEGQPEWQAFRIVTELDRRDTAEFRNLAAEIAQVDSFETFMTAYRARLRDQPLSAIY